MKRIILAIFCCCLSVWALPTLEELEHRLEGKLAPVQTIQTGFTQTREIASLKMRMTFEGTLAFECKTHRLLWKVDKPLPCAFRMQSKELTQWDGETNQLISISASTVPWIGILQTQLTQWLSGDLIAIQRQAKIAIVSDHRVRLVPKAGVMDTLATALEIEFAEDYRQVSQVRIEERDGEVMTIAFHQPVLNQPIAEAIWALPPAPKTP